MGFEIGLASFHQIKKSVSSLNDKQKSVLPRVAGYPCDRASECQMLHRKNHSLKVQGRALAATAGIARGESKTNTMCLAALPEEERRSLAITFMKTLTLTGILSKSITPNTFLKIVVQ